MHPSYWLLGDLRMTYAVGAFAARAGQMASVLARGGFGRRSARGSRAPSCDHIWAEVAGYSFAPSRRTPRNGSASTPRYPIIVVCGKPKDVVVQEIGIERFSDGHRYGKVVCAAGCSLIMSFWVAPGRRANGTCRRCGNGRFGAWAGIAADASE